MTTDTTRGTPRSAIRRAAVAWFLALALPASAQPLLLVSEEEVARERDAAPAAIVPRSAPQPGAPTIKVLAPLLGSAPLGNPIRIELAFAAEPDSQIDPTSFRAHYGALRIDLTNRIVARVTVERTGLKVDDVVIPSGNHRLLLRIADTKARTGEVELRFAVQ